MQRRNFLQLTATTTVATLLARLTQATPVDTTAMNAPTEVWIQSGDQWLRLKATNEFRFAEKDVEVTLRADGRTTGVYVSSPSQPLSAVRIKWRYNLAATANYLGDHWERSYGDLQWKTSAAGVKNPWYVLIHDTKETACFGVKTGANSICWWDLTSQSLQLTLDTHSGGNGVLLGNRTLHAADIITTRSQAGENPFRTDRRFCGLMCPKPRLPKQPVYGINDWYFAYGDNSFDLIKASTAQMAELVTDTRNRPFSVIDAGWAAYSPLLPGDGSWNEDFARPNEKFKDMHRLADQIKQLGMRPGLWMRPLCARHDQKATLLAPAIPGRNNPRRPVLDPTIPENIEHIKAYFDAYKAWGYELVKLRLFNL